MGGVNNPTDLTNTGFTLANDVVGRFGPNGEVVISSDGTDGFIDNENVTDLAIGTATADSVRLGRNGKTVVTEGDTRTTVGNGDIVADKCTTVEGGNGDIHKTTLTFTLTGANDLDLPDGGEHGTGIKIYDFPAGDILILGATINGIVTSTNAEGGGATFPMSLGSVVAADDATLTGTEADIIPSTAIAGGSTKDFHTRLAASILLTKAGGTDLDLFVNAGITDAVSEGAVTIELTGTVTITWINQGDF